MARPKRKARGKLGHVARTARKPRQPRLPQMEDPAIEELEAAAEEHEKIRNRANSAAAEAKALKEELLKLMHKHGKTSYYHSGVSVTVKGESEKVIVQIDRPKKGE